MRPNTSGHAGVFGEAGASQFGDLAVGPGEDFGSDLAAMLANMALNCKVNSSETTLIKNSKASLMKLGPKKTAVKPARHVGVAGNSFVGKVSSMATAKAPFEG
jgi:hypothetical protein